MPANPNPPSGNCSTPETQQSAALNRITPEWCLRMAELEGAQEIGAGLLTMDPAETQGAEVVQPIPLGKHAHRLVDIYAVYKYEYIGLPAFRVHYRCGCFGVFSAKTGRAYTGGDSMSELPLEWLARAALGADNADT